MQIVFIVGNACAPCHHGGGCIVDVWMFACTGGSHDCVGECLVGHTGACESVCMHGSHVCVREWVHVGLQGPPPPVRCLCCSGLTRIVVHPQPSPPLTTSTPIFLRYIIVATLNVCVITRLNWVSAAKCAVELAWDTRAIVSATSSTSPSPSGAVDVELADLAPRVDDGSDSEGSQGTGHGGRRPSDDIVIGDDDDEEEEDGYGFGAGDTNTLLRQ